jgi:hypothetical protein
MSIRESEKYDARDEHFRRDSRAEIEGQEFRRRLKVSGSL